MLKRCAACGFFLATVVLVGGCQRSSTPTRSSVDSTPLTNTDPGFDQQLMDVSLPTPGNDGGPELEGLPNLGRVGPPKPPELPPLPEPPPLPEIPVVGGALETPPEPDIPHVEENLPSVEE